MAVELRYSTFGPRFWAGFIDGLVFLPVSLADNYLSSPQRTTLVLVAWAIFSYPSYWIYTVCFHACRGQTVGKKAQQIKVLDISEQRIPSWTQAFMRDIGAAVASSCSLVYFIYIVITKQYSENPSLQAHWFLLVLGFANLGWFLLELITMFTNSKRRAFHDLIAGTVVVRVD